MNEERHYDKSRTRLCKNVYSGMVEKNLLVIQKNKLIIGITKQKFHKVKVH